MYLFLLFLYIAQGGPTNITVEATDSYNHKVRKNIKNIQNLRAQIDEIKVDSKTFVITGITTKPKQVPEVHSYNYTVRMHSFVNL